MSWLKLAATAGPEAVSAIKDNAPVVWDKAKTLWKKAGGGDLLAAANSAARKSDGPAFSAIIETLIRSGASVSDIVASHPLLDTAEFRSHLDKLRSVVQLDRTNADGRVSAQPISVDVTLAKHHEARRLERALGLDLEALAELVVFVNTTTSTQLVEVATMRRNFGS